MGINNPLSALRYRLAAFGSRLPACLRQSPPRHCVALSPLTSSGAQGRSADFRLSASGWRLSAPGCRLSASGWRLSASGFRLTDLWRRGDRISTPLQKNLPTPAVGGGGTTEWWKGCTCQQKLDTKLKKLGIKIEYLYKAQ